MVDDKIFCTRTQILICSEVLWFHETSMCHGVEKLQWNTFCVMDIVCYYCIYSGVKHTLIFGLEN
jgi:hypothetical protein